MKTIRHINLMLLLILTAGIQTLSFCQVTGPSTNLCPGVIYTYTSPSGCLNPYGWACDGCVPGTLNSSGNIINVGTNPDGTVFAKVAWSNTAGGYGDVRNICGTLNIGTNSIEIASSSPICSSETFSATLVNPNPNPSLSWSSGNSGLVINSSTGYATRVNNFNGSVTVTATYACGSNQTSSQSSTVWVGNPVVGSLDKNVNNPPFCAGETIGVSVDYVPNSSYSWTSSDNSILEVSGSSNSGVLDGISAGSCTFSVVASNTCGSGSSIFHVIIQNCDGGSEMLSVFPNPVSNTLTIQVTDSTSTISSNTLDQHINCQSRTGIQIEYFPHSLCRRI